MSLFLSKTSFPFISFASFTLLFCRQIRDFLSRRPFFVAFYERRSIVIIGVLSEFKGRERAGVGNNRNGEIMQQLSVTLEKYAQPSRNLSALQYFLLRFSCAQTRNTHVRGNTRAVNYCGN